MNQWQRGDRLINSVTGDTGTIIGMIRGNPSMHPSPKISLDKGGITTGQQSTLESQGWKRSCQDNSSADTTS